MLWGFEPINIVFFAQTQTIIWAVATIGATILFMKARHWPTLLILIGSVAYFLMSANNAFFEMATNHNWIPIDSSFWQHWSISLLDNAAGVATIFLPVGLLLYALRMQRRI
jgi:hypothetical protein